MALVDLFVALEALDDFFFGFAFDGEDLGIVAVVASTSGGVKFLAGTGGC